MATPPTADHHGGRFVSVSLPADALVLLIGVAASGKSTFAARHFAPTEVLSSDRLRALITDNPSAQGATGDAFDLLHRIGAMRLRRGRLTVVDATNVEAWAREELLAMARRHRRPSVAIILDLPLTDALERNAARPAPRPPAAAIHRRQMIRFRSPVERESASWTADRPSNAHVGTQCPNRGSGLIPARSAVVLEQVPEGSYCPPGQH